MNGVGVAEKHPRGLYVLFATEMWERFSFYTMNGMLVLYMTNAVQGFGWSAGKAASINSYYLFFVYFTPLLGGFLADRVLGFRRAITIGGVFFAAGHLLLAVPDSVPVFFLALTCLVIGNGFFKPNISSLVGNLYREGSHLKDKAYLIFYMGINIGAAMAPIIATVVRTKYGFHPAFAVAAGGMVLSLVTFWGFRQHIIGGDRKKKLSAMEEAQAAQVTEDFPPPTQEQSELERIPEWKRIAALIVIFLVVIVFWMVFHQNSSTLTLWANDNTDWNVSGILSNAINPIWIIILALPLAAFWSFLDRRGLEPSTPTKIAIGMLLTGASFMVLWFAAKAGGYTAPSTVVLQSGPSTSEVYIDLSPEARKALSVTTPGTEIELTTNDPSEKQTILKREAWLARTTQPLEPDDLVRIDSVSGSEIMISPVSKVSPMWLIMGYFVLSLGELCLSPMGLSLVSKVAPVRMRGLMMGGWFAATAIGNKLTAIGVFWDQWSHAKFFLVLALMAFAMFLILLTLLRPLKRAMPGV